MSAQLVQQINYTGIIQELPTMTAAIERTLALGGLHDQAAAYALGVDYSALQRMFRQGDKRYFPPDLIETAMELGHNDLALEYLAFRRGRATYPLQFMQLLAGIKESLSKEGRMVCFSLGIR